MTELWEILVPTVSNEGKPFRTRYHRVWDAKVRDIAGGITILAPARGQWVNSEAKLFAERMIPVRVAIRIEDPLGPSPLSKMRKVAAMTKEYYRQERVMYYRMSDCVVFE